MDRTGEDFLKLPFIYCKWVGHKWGMEVTRQFEGVDSLPPPCGFPKTELQSPDLTAGAFTKWSSLSPLPPRVTSFLERFLRLLPMADPAQGASLSLGSCCPIPSVIQAMVVHCLIKSGIPDYCVCLFVSRVASKKAFPASVSLPNPKFKQSRILSCLHSNSLYSPGLPFPPEEYTSCPFLCFCHNLKATV